MRHFAAYHSPERMGYLLPDGEIQKVLTRRPVKNLLNQMVWIITFKTKDVRQFVLGSVFLADSVGKTDERGFNAFASGAGHVFRPHIPIGETVWFPKLRQVTGNFAFGVREIKDQSVISGLTGLAENAGYKLTL